MPNNERVKQLFLIDGLGAVLSAFLLGVVLTTFESTFGMPRKTLYLLAALPCFFVIYDLYCYLRITENLRLFLRAIAIANLLYCCLSIALLIHHYDKLTNLGLIYFLLECVVIIILVGIEFKAASNT